MRIKRRLSASLAVTLIAFNSKVVMAAEGTGSNFLSPIWIIIFFIIIAVVFRKQLISALPVNVQEPDNSAIQEQAPSGSKHLTLDIESTDKKTKVKNEIIDLKDNSAQCQASTAKGTRCKRKTTLEDTLISIDNKTYSLTVCKQHNTDSLKPFPEFLMSGGE